MRLSEFFVKYVFLFPQEELLHSVLPVHLTVELRNKMLERLKIASIDTHVQQKRSAYGRFHDLYMRVHDNVT